MYKLYITSYKILKKKKYAITLFYSYFLSNIKLYYILLNIYKEFQKKKNK